MAYPLVGEYHIVDEDDGDVGKCQEHAVHDLKHQKVLQRAVYLSNADNYFIEENVAELEGVVLEIPCFTGEEGEVVVCEGPGRAGNCAGVLRGSAH